MRSIPQSYVDTICALGGPPLTVTDVIAAWHIGPTPVLLAHFLRRPVTPADMDCYHRHADTAATAARPFPG
jgi:hypothetical protein